MTPILKQTTCEEVLDDNSVVGVEDTSSEDVDGTQIL